MVIALDSSPAALERARANAALNGLENIEWREVDAFEGLRAMARAREQFDMIVLDPPAFAKTRASVPDALRGYREINLRAMRCLAPGGTLLTASCSFHVRVPDFLGMLTQAAGDSGRRIRVRHILGAGEDHPQVLTVPETGYLKAALLQSE
jgi:23S rRNA (cytosine1962-C5)-methyltransferase